MKKLIVVFFVLLASVGWGQTLTVPNLEVTNGVRVEAYTAGYSEPHFSAIGISDYKIGSFTTEIVDSHNAFSVATFTAPVSGVYSVTASLLVDVSSAAGACTAIRIRSSAFPFYFGENRTTQNNFNNPRASVHATFYMSAGNTCSVEWTSNTGSAVAASSSITIYQVR
jgi:hypothetical protein